MWPRHPQQKRLLSRPAADRRRRGRQARSRPDAADDAGTPSGRSSFIERNSDKPFFLYVPHSMPHVPLFVSDKFKGKTARGLYGDVIAEIDWSVGQILDAVKRANLDDDTLVIFTSDNGPWLSYGNHAGSPGRCAKARGRRARAACGCRSSPAGPGRIPAGTVVRRAGDDDRHVADVRRLAGAPPPRSASSTAATSGRC